MGGDGTMNRDRPYVRSWLFADYLIAAIGRLLCDPIADGRASELEWPFWVGFGHSVATAKIGCEFNRSMTGQHPIT
jgi:hypothetical protein